MGKKTPADKLAESIEKILQEYQDDVIKDTGKLAKDFAKKGAKAVKDSARSTFGGTGKYANGWTSTYESGRVSSQGIIYNKDVPGLAHLLENGHAKRGGGRVSGKAHIAPVEDKISEEFYKAVKEAI